MADMELVIIVDELLQMKGEWLTRPVMERRKIMKKFQERVEDMSIDAPYDTDMGMIHHYGDNTYGREANVPAGVALVGSVYGQPQINVMLRGAVFVMTENVIDIMVAPCIFTSDPNTNKVGYVIEDMQWMTVTSRDNDTIDPVVIMKQHTMNDLHVSADEV